MIRVLILAGGKGTRMGSVVPKPLVQICGRPMIDRILETVSLSGVDERPAVVVGYSPELVKEKLGERAEVVMQEEQRGTGHAVMVAEKFLKGADIVLVTYGDHALFSEDTFSNIVDVHKKSGAVITMLTTLLSDYDEWRSVYTHFGRIIRDGGDVEIKEYKMCSDDEKGILEVNNGMYCFDGEWLWENISLLSDDNVKKEFLLTDLIKLARLQGENISTVHCSPEEGIGVNTPEEVAIAERVLCGDNNL